MHMKKTLILLTSAVLASTVLTANATYNVIYGEKQINGDNIRFTTKTTPPVDPPTTPPDNGKECSTRDMSSKEASWTAGTPSYAVLAISWGGVQILVDGDYLAAEKIIAGYKYTRGEDLLGGSGYSSTYTICRIKI